MVNATFNNIFIILWKSVLVMEKTKENHKLRFDARCLKTRSRKVLHLSRQCHPVCKEIRGPIRGVAILDGDYLVVFLLSYCLKFDLIRGVAFCGKGLMRRGLLYQVHIPYDPGHDDDGLNFGLQKCSFEFHTMYGFMLFLHVFQNRLWHYSTYDVHICVTQHFDWISLDYFSTNTSTVHVPWYKFKEYYLINIF